MIGNLGFTEILMLGGVVVLLFGAKKIPELARGMGQGLNIFRNELNQKEGSNSKESDSETPPSKD